MYVGFLLFSDWVVICTYIILLQPAVSTNIKENPGLKKVSSSLKTPLPPDPTKYVHMHDNIMLFI